MATIPPSTEEIYLGLKDLFRGEAAKMRQTKAIRNAIEKCKGYSGIRGLLARANIEIICCEAQELLQENVFADEKVAKVYFSKIPQQPPPKGLSAGALKLFKQEEKGEKENAEIYLGLRDVFKDEIARNSDYNEVRIHIEKHKENPKVRKLLDQFPMDSVHGKAITFVRRGLFAREDVAKLWYPHLFSATSTTQTSNTKPTSATATKATQISGLDAAALLKASKAFSSKPDTNNVVNETAKETASTNSTTPNQHKFTTDAGVKVPSLFPVMTPSAAQYSVLKNLHEIIEKSCFKFAKENLEQVVQENGWTCWQHVDPSKWSGVLRTAFDENKLTQPLARLDLEALLLKLGEIRTLTTTRNQVTGEKLEQLLETAERFLQLLRDEEAEQTVRTLLKNTKSALEQLKEKKEQSELMLEAQLKRIKAAKEALDKEEVEAVKCMLDCDKDHVQTTDVLLESASRWLSPTKSSARLTTPSNDSEDYEVPVVDAHVEVSERGRFSPFPERVTTPFGATSEQSNWGFGAGTGAVRSSSASPYARASVLRADESFMGRGSMGSSARCDRARASSSGSSNWAYEIDSE